MKKKPETGQWFFEPNEEDEELAQDIRYIYTLLADGGYFKTRWGKRHMSHILSPMPLLWLLVNHCIVFPQGAKMDLGC
jgi:hypothetical protein